MIWNEAKECMSRDQRADLQGKQLVKLVKYVYRNVGYYRKKMKKIGIEPGDIHGIEDLCKLPFTTREDLLDAYPYGMFAVPVKKIVRYGTAESISGEEMFVGYTQKDLMLWSECMARSIAMAGMNRNDVIQIAYNYGNGTEGLGALYGAEKIGATAIPSAVCRNSDLMSAIRKFRVTGIMGTPSYLMYIVQMIEKKGIGSNLRLRAAVCGGASWTENTRKKIQDVLGIKMYDIYGLNELMGLGVASECGCQQGMHVQEDYFITEVLDTDTLIAVVDGVLGEIVFTTLQKQGIPLIRFRTMNVTRINHVKCECGRTTARIDRICDRTEDIVFIRGNSVILFRIESVLSELKDIKASYTVYIRKEHGLDEVDVCIESNKTNALSQSESEENLKKRVAAAVRSIIGMTPNVYITEGHSPNFYNRKKVAIIDER